jgi:hypothetical protein
MATQAISVTSAGNNTVIAVGSGNGIVIRQMVLQANAEMEVTFKAGSMALSGPMTFAAGGGLMIGDATASLWVFDAPDDFVISLSGGLIYSLAGWLVYDIY